MDFAYHVEEEFSIYNQQQTFLETCQLKQQKNMSNIGLYLMWKFLVNSQNKRCTFEKEEKFCIF